MNQLSGAPIVMHKKGRLTDVAVLKEIMIKPGIAIAEIAENLEWTNGKVDGSVNRLIVEGKASVKHNLKKGMLVKTVYPVDFDKKQNNIVRIPTELVSCDLWREKAFVYALSRSTIGVAPHEVGEWGVKAFSVDCVSVEKRFEVVILKLPERLAGFYQLENSEISLSAVGDLVFITVETVLPVKFTAQSVEKSKYALVQH
jgi:hypothetical protein